jgi:hypothetical protein
VDAYDRVLAPRGRSAVVFCAAGAEGIEILPDHFALSAIGSIERVAEQILGVEIALAGGNLEVQRLGQVWPLATNVVSREPAAEVEATKVAFEIGQGRLFHARQHAEAVPAARLMR